MRIIAAGGTGQIGARLCSLLAERGHEVWVLTRRPGRTAPRAGLKYVEWDAMSAGPWANLVDGAGAVINLAGENIGGKPWTPEHLASIRASRLNAGRALVDAIRMAGNPPGLLVQASAVGYYGADRDAAFDESSPAGYDELAAICVDWEASTRAVEERGVRRVVVRTGLVLEKDQGVLPRMLLPFLLLVGGPLGDGRQVLSWIHLSDELAALIFLIENPAAHGVYNLTAPEPVTNREFGRILAGVIRRPFWFPVPAWGLKLLLGRQSELVLKGQRVLPRRLTEAGFDFQFPGLQGALQNLLK